MATQSRHALNHLVRRLQTRPKHFGYFEVLHQFDRHVGAISTRSLDELLQVRPSLSLACPTSDLDAFEILPPLDVDDERDRFRLTVNFLGLYGVDSPLPDYYLEEFVQHDDEESPRRRFLDVFHQRLYGLLYQCWKKYRFYVQYRPDGGDVFSRRMFALGGLGPPKVRERLGFPAQRLLPFLGLLSRRESSPAVLEDVVGHVIGRRIRVEPFALARVAIASGQRIRLGRANARLGRDMTLGRSVLSRSHRFAVRVEDLTPLQFQSMLPGASRRVLVDRVLRQTLRRPLDYDIVLKLRERKSPGIRLGRDSATGLGRTSWLSGAGAATQTVRFRRETAC